MPALVPFLVVFIIVQLAGQMPGSLWIISSMDRYGWSRELVGASFSAYGLLMAISQAFLTGPVTERLEAMSSGRWSSAFSVEWHLLRPVRLRDAVLDGSPS